MESVAHVQGRIPCSISNIKTSGKASYTIYDIINIEYDIVYDIVYRIINIEYNIVYDIGIRYCIHITN